MGCKESGVAVYIFKSGCKYFWDSSRINLIGVVNKCGNNVYVCGWYGETREDVSIIA